MLLPPGLAAPPVEGLQLSQSTSKQVAPAHHHFNLDGEGENHIVVNGDKNICKKMSPFFKPMSLSLI
jgi:hypothetical protein